MEEKSRLKEEAESLVAGNEHSNYSLALKADASPSDLQASELNINPIQIIKDSVAQREEKRLADQEFLELYRNDEKRARILFSIIVFLLVAAFGFGVPKFFEYTDHARKVNAHFVPAVGSALIGEKDAAYFQTANFSLPLDDTHAAKLVEARMKILDHSIAELEGSGRTAIFSRLGAEQLLLRNGERGRALKYGDYLNEKYPKLPSNYFFRAHVDFETGNFAQAVNEYEQSLALLKDSSLKAQQGWATQIREAIWAAINSGQMDKARTFYEAYDKYGGTKFDYDNVAGSHGEDYFEMNQAILLAQYDQLDLAELRNTSFYNTNLERYASELLKKAQSGNTSPYYLDDIRTTLGMNVRAGNLVGARENLRDLERYSFQKYLYTIGAAEVAIGAGEPKVAVDVLSKYNLLHPPVASTSLLLATALQQLHLTAEGLIAADQGLTQYKQFSTEPASGKYYLPLLLIKARLLSDSGQFSLALQLCDKVLAANPQLVGPQLLKIQIMQQQHTPQEKIEQLRAELRAQLKKLKIW